MNKLEFAAHVRIKFQLLCNVINYGHRHTEVEITLLNHPMTKLTDAKIWAQWKDFPLQYYSPDAMQDAAYYLICAL